MAGLPCLLLGLLPNSALASSITGSQPEEAPFVAAPSVQPMGPIGSAAGQLSTTPDRPASAPAVPPAVPKPRVGTDAWNAGSHASLGSTHVLVDTWGYFQT